MINKQNIHRSNKSYVNVNYRIPLESMATIKLISQLEGVTQLDIIVRALDRFIAEYNMGAIVTQIEKLGYKVKLMPQDEEIVTDETSPEVGEGV